VYVCVHYLSILLLLLFNQPSPKITQCALCTTPTTGRSVGTVPPTPTLSSHARFESALDDKLTCVHAHQLTHTETLAIYYYSHPDHEIQCVCVRVRAQPDQHNEVSSSARARTHTHTPIQPTPTKNYSVAVDLFSLFVDNWRRLNISQLGLYISITINQSINEQVRGID
jgi:hypothetical protein